MKNSPIKKNTKERMINLKIILIKKFKLINNWLNPIKSMFPILKSLKKNSRTKHKEIVKNKRDCKDSWL